MSAVSCMRLTRAAAWGQSLQRASFAARLAGRCRWLSTTPNRLVDLSKPYDELYKTSIAQPAEFWSSVSERIDWIKPFDEAKDVDLDNAHIEWFKGGQLNVSENCVDRHVAAGKGDQAALIWESDDAADGQTITYSQLKDEVSRLANVLKDNGVEKGDTVCIYMPMTPHIVYAMLACARIGAVHTIVFAGFSATALEARIQNAGSKVVITADQGVRGGKTIPLKEVVDRAVKNCPDVQTVLVQSRTGADVAMGPLDVNLNDAMAAASPDCPVVPVDSEDPLFVLFTSGSTGTPKGLTHTSGGYITYAAFTHEKIFDYQEGDVYCCAADAGWITGHTYVVYGPLANGATTVLFESIPTFPDAGRYWEMVERLKVNQFYTAPTAIRLLIKSGDEYVTKYDRSSLKLLGSVGEPINPEAWNWYNEVVGEKRCPIVDTWWQTETGGIMMTPLPEDTNMKPGAAMKPFYGAEPILMDTKGKPMEGNNSEGNLCFKQINPGMARSIWGDHDRFKQVYYDDYPGYYFTGDGCKRDEDGHYWITGRVDDVINVSGHRLGSAEIESALVGHSSVAEAAVVGFPHEIKGQGIYAYVTLKDGEAGDDEKIKELRAIVAELVGPFARPDVIHLAPGLPKTRSGKIMRRILRKVASDDYGDLGDTSTLNEPAVVDDIIAKHEQLK